MTEDNDLDTLADELVAGSGATGALPPGEWEPFLEPGEALLWFGAPVKGFWAQPAWLNGVKGAAMGVLMLLGILSAVTLVGAVFDAKSLHLDEPLKRDSPIMPILLLAFLYPLTYPLIQGEQRLRERTRIAVTDRRVLVWEAIGRRPAIASFARGADAVITRHSEDVLALARSSYKEGLADKLPFGRPSSRLRGKTPAVWLRQVPGTDRVETLLQADAAETAAA